MYYIGFAELSKCHDWGNRSACAKPFSDVRNTLGNSITIILIHHHSEQL